MTKKEYIANRGAEDAEDTANEGAANGCRIEKQKIADS